MGEAGTQASAQADTGYMRGRGEKGVVGLTLEDKQRLLSRCPESWRWASPQQTRTNRGNLGQQEVGRQEKNPLPAESGGPAGPFGQGRRGAKPQQDHKNHLLEENHSQVWGWARRQSG